jgi:uncharacterized protein (DUF58 family)
MTGARVDDHVLRRLPRLRLRLRHGPGAGRAPAGTPHGRRPGYSREFLGLRPYEAGDDLRDIDRAATQRFDRPYVRLYQQEVEAALLLLIDVSASMAFGEPSKLQYAQGLATALGRVALTHHDRVGALAFGASTVAAVPARRGAGHWRALRALVEGLEPGAATSFEPDIDVVAALGAMHGIVLVLSDFYPPERFARGLRRLARCPVKTVALQILSPQELVPAIDGERVLVDIETGEVRAGAIGAAQRAAYQRALERLCGEVAMTCREAGIGYARVSTAESTLACLQGALVRSGVLVREGLR